MGESVNMKPVINVVYDEDNNPIVVLSKKISGLDAYDKAKETRKFYTSEIKQFESVISFQVLDILNDYGIIPYDESDDAFESALTKLAEIYHKQISIVDMYSDFNGKIVIRLNRRTIIEDDDELSVANKIILEEVKNVKKY